MLQKINTRPFVISIGLLTSFIILWAMQQHQFVARENDSRLYTRFVKQLALRPLSHVIAPKWPAGNHYADREVPYVRDHLPGQFILPVVLAKLGMPAAYSLYYTNILIRIISLWLFYLIALFYLSHHQALYVPIFMQFLSINFTYQLRANHEHPLLLFVLLGILGCLNYKQQQVRAWLLISISVLGAFFLKGLAFIPLLAGLPLFLIINYKNKLKNLTYAVVLFLIFLFACTAFEYLFSLASDGVSFFEKYIDEQILRRSVNKFKVNFFVGYIKSFNYYFFRLFFYSAPLSLVFLGVVIKNKLYKRKDQMINIISDPLLFMTLSYLLFFSFSQRTASRYLYPAYYTLALAFIITILNNINLKKISTAWAVILSLSIFTMLAYINIFLSIGNHLKYTN